MRKLVRPLIGLLILVMMQSLNAAQRLGPPIEDLQSEPDRTRIVIAVASEKAKSPRILFTISERLSGEAPDEVLLRTDEETFADVEVGRSYVVAWSYMRRNRRVVGGWENDPAGPFTVQLKGLGSSAVLTIPRKSGSCSLPARLTSPETAASKSMPCWRNCSGRIFAAVV